MDNEKLLYKILDEVGKANTEIAVVKSKQDAHLEAHKQLLKDQANLKSKHYKLEEDFRTHKTKTSLIIGFIGSLFGGAISTGWHYISQKF